MAALNQKLISEYYKSSKSDSARHIVKKIAPENLMIIDKRKGLWIKLRKDFSLQFHITELESEPAFATSLNLDDDAAISATPKVIKHYIKREWYCRTCYEWVQVSKMNLHSISPEHAEHFYYASIDSGIFALKCDSHVIPEILQRSLSNSVCTVSDFFACFKTHFSDVSLQPISEGAYCQVFHGIEKTSQNHVAIKMFNEYSTPADIMKEYTMMKSFAYAHFK